MNDSNERFIPEAIDVQEERQDQLHYLAWQSSSHHKFVYGLERIDQADAHSLKRVWGRLVEHAENNGIVYHSNKNIVHLREKQKRSVRKAWESRIVSKCREFAGRFDKVATACILTLLIGSMIFIYNVTHHAASGTASVFSNVTHTTAVSLQDYHPQTIEVSIILDKDGVAAFKQSMLKIPVKTTLIWHNLTGTAQIAVSESHNQDIPLAPSGINKLDSTNMGLYAWHLQSNPNARFVASVFGTAKVSIMPSKDTHAFDFVPNTLHLTTGSVVLWVNTTNQDQVIVGGNNASSPSIKLAPAKYVNMPVNTRGNYPFHLASDPNANFFMVVDV
jgi:hypothetical protein